MSRNDLSTAKLFDFPNMLTNFGGYNSARDKTNINEALMVRGSQNIYKKINGNLSNRPGQKRLGDANSTLSPVSSEFIWNTSSGNTWTMIVSDSKLYGVLNNVWYTLLTGVTNTRYVFDTWWSTTELKDYLVMVNGAAPSVVGAMSAWSGGIATVASVSTNAISMVGQVGLTGTPTMTGTAPFTSYFNGRTDNLFNGGFTLNSNPTNGQTILYTINGVGPITITFVTAIGAAAGNVLIGANTAATLANLLGLLKFPATTSATQVALSAPNQTAVGKANYASTEALVKTGTTTWEQAGFGNSSAAASYSVFSLLMNGTTYTYTTGTGTLALFGFTPSIAAITAGTIAIQSVKQLDFTTSTTLFPVTFTFDFIKTIQNQLYLGAYNSPVCYVSKASDFTNFTQDVVAIQGSAAQIPFDGNLRGLTNRGGKPYAGLNNGKWGIINYNYTNSSTGGSGGTLIIYRTTTVEYTPVSAGAGPYAHEFIDSNGDNIIYLSADQQVRTFGNFNNSFTSNNYPVLSQEIYTELTEKNFTGGSLKTIGDIVYLTVPTTGQVYMRQQRQTVDANGQTVNEITWFSPFVWNLTRVDNLNGTIVGFSNANPQIYQLWNTGQWYDDSPSGEQIPYESRIAFAYRTGGKREYNYEFDKVFTEGYIDPGTELNLLINYNYNGSTGQVATIINSNDRPAVFYSVSASSLGESSFGDESLGGTTDDDADTDLIKFKNINSLSLVNMFEYQLQYSSELANAQWEILATGTNARVVESQPSYLINKLR